MLAAARSGFRLFQYNINYVVMMMVRLGVVLFVLAFFLTWLVVTRLVSGGRFSMLSSQMICHE
jgi:hypothetical protein